MWWLHNKTLLGEKVDHLLPKTEKTREEGTFENGREQRKKKWGDEVVLKGENYHCRSYVGVMALDDTYKNR